MAGGTSNIDRFAALVHALSRRGNLLAHPTLTAACERMLRDPLLGAGKSADPSRLPMELLEKAYHDWHRHAISALQNAMAVKKSGETLPPLIGDPFEGYTPESIAARSTANPSVWNRELSGDVVKYYLEDQKRRSWVWARTGCRSALTEVASGFRP